MLLLAHISTGLSFVGCSYAYWTVSIWILLSFQVTSRNGCLMKLSFLNIEDDRWQVDLARAVKSGVGPRRRIPVMAATEHVTQGKGCAGEKGAAVVASVAARAVNGRHQEVPGELGVNREIRPPSRRRRRIMNRLTAATSRTVQRLHTLTEVSIFF